MPARSRTSCQRQRRWVVWGGVRRGCEGWGRVKRGHLLLQVPTHDGWTAVKVLTDMPCRAACPCRCVTATGRWRRCPTGSRTGVWRSRAPPTERWSSTRLTGANRPGLPSCPPACPACSPCFSGTALSRRAPLGTWLWLRCSALGALHMQALGGLSNHSRRLSKSRPADGSRAAAACVQNSCPMPVCLPMQRCQRVHARL